MQSNEEEGAVDDRGGSLSGSIKFLGSSSIHSVLFEVYTRKQCGHKLGIKGEQTDSH